MTRFLGRGHHCLPGLQDQPPEGPSAGAPPAGEGGCQPQEGPPPASPLPVPRVCALALETVPVAQTKEHRREHSLSLEARRQKSRGPCDLCLCSHLASPPPVCVQICLFLEGRRSHWVRTHPSPAWPPLNWIVSAKTLFPNKVPFTASVRHDFWGTTPNPMQSHSPSSLMSEIREGIPKAGWLVGALDTA